MKIHIYPRVNVWCLHLKISYRSSVIVVTDYFNINNFLVNRKKFITIKNFIVWKKSEISCVGDWYTIRGQLAKNNRLPFQIFHLFIFENYNEKLKWVQDNIITQEYKYCIHLFINGFIFKLRETWLGAK